MKSQVSVIHVTHSSVYCVVVFFNGTQEAEMTGSHYEDIGGDEVSIKTLPEKKKKSTVIQNFSRRLFCFLLDFHNKICCFYKIVEKPEYKLST